MSWRCCCGWVSTRRKASPRRRRAISPLGSLRRQLPYRMIGSGPLARPWTARDSSTIDGPSLTARYIGCRSRAARRKSPPRMLQGPLVCLLPLDPVPGSGRASSYSVDRLVDVDHAAPCRAGGHQPGRRAAPVRVVCSVSSSALEVLGRALDAAGQVDGVAQRAVLELVRRAGVADPGRARC